MHAVKTAATTALTKEFAKNLGPLGGETAMRILKDNRTGAHFCECHVQAEKLIAFGTTDVPLDPEHPEYRANREIVANSAAVRANEGRRATKEKLQQHRRGILPK